MSGRKEILQAESPVLHLPTHPVSLKDIGTPRLDGIIAEMKHLLEKEEDGVGIAAPQIGIPLRIFIVSHRAFEFIDAQNKHKNLLDDPSMKPEYKDLVCINPEIIKLSKKKRWIPEGCLSVRWIYGETLRSEKAAIRAYDEYGKLFSRGGSGLLAQIFQHEIDHLSGILFTDHAKNLEKINPSAVQDEEKK